MEEEATVAETMTRMTTVGATQEVAVVVAVVPVDRTSVRRSWQKIPWVGTEWFMI